jgi:DnaJ-class molecular chaperone
MVRSPDYYALLEVDPGAPVEIIRTHYCARARRDHPDHPTGSTEAMVHNVVTWVWRSLGRIDHGRR